MRAKNPYRGKGRGGGRGRGRESPTKKPNVGSEQVVCQNQQALFNFVSKTVVQGNDFGLSQSDNEDPNDEEFDPVMEVDSGNSSPSSVSESGGSETENDEEENTKSLNVTVERLIRKYVEENFQMGNSSKGTTSAGTMALTPWTPFGGGFQNQQQEPTQDPVFNKKELNSTLAVIKRVMKMDAAAPFRSPVDPIAQRLPDYFNVIETPMDFGTICNHLQNGTKYMNSEDVFKDVEYIWKNCSKYYNEGNYVLDLMTRVKEKFMKYWTDAGLYRKKQSTSNASSSSSLGKKRMRGPTRNLKLMQIPVGVRFDISWRNGRVVGENTKLFKSECTALVRQTQDIPLQVKSWRQIPLDTKTKAFEHMLKRFKVEDHMDFVLDQIHRCYKHYRTDLKRKYFDLCETVEEAHENVPPNVTEDDWLYLVSLWNSPKWQALSKINRENNAKNSTIHTTGSKSYSEIFEEAKEKTGKEPGRALLWELTHVRPDGTAANPASQEALLKLKNAQMSAEATQMTEDEIFEKVFGPERSKKTTREELRDSQSSSTVIELRRQLEESKQRQEESEQRSAAEVQSLKEQLGRVESLLSEKMNRFEGLLTHLTSHMHSPALANETSPSQTGRRRLMKIPTKR